MFGVISFLPLYLQLVTGASATNSGLGVATGTVAFFRSVGGSFGVAAFGAIFTSRLADELASSLGPRALDALPPSFRDGFVQAFSHALTATFRYAVPCILVAFLITWFLREQPLRGAARAGDPGRELAGRCAADGS